MRSSLSRVALALSLLAFTLPLGACKTSPVRIEIPGFSNGDVDGLWFWRFSEESGRFERACRVDISNPLIIGGKESVEYVQLCDSVESFAITLASPIERLSGGSIVVQIYFIRWESDPGVFRASAFNRSGESGLSATELTL
jgi:hypothetical protein